jgi:hypothetical protein
MDEQTFLHQISVKTGVNIELLKDLYHSEKFWSLVKNNGCNFDGPNDET